MELQARVRVWGRPRGRSGTRAPRVSSTHSVREDARVGAGSDGMRSQADRRVEVMFFDGGEEPDLAATNGEDIYDGVTFERTRIEPLRSARKVDCFIRCFGYDDEPVSEGTVYDVHIRGVIRQVTAGKGGVASIRLPPSTNECDLIEWEAPAVGGKGS